MIEATPSPFPAAAAPSPNGWWREFFGAPEPATPPPPFPTGPDTPPRLAPGSVLGDWEILKHLGSGGMSHVFEAFYRPGHRRYALKVLDQDHAEDPMAVRRFELEYLALTRVSHAAVVSPFLAGRERGVHYYAMELLDGESLERVYTRALVDPLRAAKIGIVVAEALASLHARSIIHRDIKPGNLFLPKDGGVKLLDLGIAKLLPEFYVDVEMRLPPEQRPQTGPGAYVGTPGYMAPEAALGARAAPSQDIFGLAATLFRVITGRSPYPSLALPEEGDEPVPAVSLGRPIPPPLEEVLRRALAVNPALRQASMGSLRDQLMLAVDEIEASEAEDQRAVPEAKGDDPRHPPDAPTVQVPPPVPAEEQRAAARDIARRSDEHPAIKPDADRSPRRERLPSRRRWEFPALATMLLLNTGVALYFGALEGSARERRNQSGTITAARLGRAVDRAVAQVSSAENVAAAPELDAHAEAEAVDPPALEAPPPLVDEDASPAFEGLPALEESDASTAILSPAIDRPHAAPARRRGLGKAAFGQAIAPQRTALALCVRDDPGKVARQIAVDLRPSGEVDEIRITPSASYISTRCVDRTIRGVSFPQAQAPSTHRITLDAPQERP